MKPKSAYYIASRKTLKLLAAIFWVIGAAVLIHKGTLLLLEADQLATDRHNTIWAAVIGTVVGGLKGYLVFSRSCRKNLVRIQSLGTPRIWQFFRPRFFLFLTLMIVLGAILSRMAHGDYLILLGVGALDLSIGCALLVSFRNFFTTASDAR